MFSKPTRNYKAVFSINENIHAIKHKLNYEINPFVHTVVPEQQNILIKNSHVLYVSMGNRGLLGKTMDDKERRLGMGEATMVLLREVA